MKKLTNQTNDSNLANLIDFIKSSPTAFHTIYSITKILNDNGFKRLSEDEAFNIKAGGKYYVTRNDSSIIAFIIQNAKEAIKDYSFKITASHSDYPTFKLKENAEITVNDKYTKLDTEGYGGMICPSWMDRPLSIAGRVIVKENDTFVTRLINIDRDLVLIPNLAIHMNRKINEEYKYNKQVDMLPLLSGRPLEMGALMQLIADDYGLDKDSIFGMDLYLYNRMEPSVWGIENEFISATALDDLECAYTSLAGFINSIDANNDMPGNNKQSISVYACFDNEEVGSGTKQGAASTFLQDIFKRINLSLGNTEEDYYRAVSKSFMVSCDNAHAVHPNHTDKTDVKNCAYINDGIVIKSHAGQKYTSDAVSIAVFKDVCKKANVPYQFFANRSDAEGGSTLGNIAMRQVSMNTVDIGLPQLAMHSAYETAGCKDIDYMVKALTKFYSM